MKENELKILYEKPELIVEGYFKDKDGNPLKLAPYQLEFIKEALSLKHTRLCTVAATQCLAHGTKVIMFDGSLKEVQDVKIGDLVMGDDSTARTVIETHSGIEEMFKVIPQGNYAKEYIVNLNHILCLAHRLKHKKLEYVNEPIYGFIPPIAVSGHKYYYGYQKPVNWKEQETKLDPYFLGLWLGDGHSKDTQITSNDKEIANYLYEYADSIGLKVSTYCDKKTTAIDYGLRGKTWRTNIILDELRSLNLIKNKHIPKEYLINSREKRLKLLAGLIDTDGHKPKEKKKQNTCEITFVSKRLAEDTVFLARSLGFRASINKKRTTCQNGYVGEAYRIMLYGELWLIPTKIKRKQWAEQKLFNIPQNYGIRIQPVGKGEYFGFETDGNHHFLLEDFTVCHNSGKSESIACLLALFAIFFPNERIVNISYTEQQAIIIFERVKAHLVEDSDVIRNLVDLDRSLGKYKEFSKTRMFMRNGTDIRVLSVGTGETDKTGEGLLGFESTVLCIDEASSIPTEVFYTKILRMLGAKRSTGHDKILILSGTPQTAGGYFEDAFNDPEYFKIQIDWRRAVAAGRMDEKTVMEQKRKMTKSQFMSWYEAKFPPMGEDSVFDIEECKRNVVEQDTKFYGRKILGVDVARFGQDVSVYMLIDKTKDLTKQDVYRIVDIVWDEQKDLMGVAGRIANLHATHKFDVINVDDTGLGGGVTDRLKEQGLPVFGIVAGSSCTTKDAQDTCLNLKAELYMKAKKLFEDDRLKIIDKGRLLYELRQMKKEFQSNGKLKIIDPSKSPDFCSSLIYSLHESSTGTFITVDFSSSREGIKLGKA